MPNGILILLILCLFCFRLDSAEERTVHVGIGESTTTEVTAKNDTLKSRQTDKPDKNKIGRYESQTDVQKYNRSKPNLQTDKPDKNEIRRYESQTDGQKYNRSKQNLYTRKSPVKLIPRNSESEINQLALESIQGNERIATGRESKDEVEYLNQYSIKNDMIRIMKSIGGINGTTKVIARTDEYNDIVLCKISDRRVNELPGRIGASKESERRVHLPKYEHDSEKKIIFIVHGLSAMGFDKVPCLNQERQLKKLLQFYTAHLDKFDIFLVPLANPDGTQRDRWGVDQSQLYWNKNKSPQEACSGVDLDRNFDIAWNFSANSCSQHYPGPEPFSEKESRAIADVLHDYSYKIVAYIHVHAGTYSADVFKGDAVLYPKGFTEVNTEDDKYIDLRSEIDESLKNAGFKAMSVTVNSLYNWYGKVSGTSVDYAASVYGIPYAMEFVMQVYNDEATANSDEYVSNNILTEIWKRIIDIVFTNIYKNTQPNDVK